MREMALAWRYYLGFPQNIDIYRGFIENSVFFGIKKALVLHKGWCYTGTRIYREIESFLGPKEAQGRSGAKASLAVCKCGCCMRRRRRCVHSPLKLHFASKNIEFLDKTSKTIDI